MTFKKYNHTNNAFCELLTDLQSSDTTMMLTGNFNRLPTSNFIVKISKYQGSKCVARENIYVANRNNNICTGLVRAYEKVPMDDDATEGIQQALNFSAGDMVECVVSSEIIQDLQNQTEIIARGKSQRILDGHSENYWIKLGKFSGGANRLQVTLSGGVGYNSNANDQVAITDIILQIGNGQQSRNCSGYFANRLPQNSIIEAVRVKELDRENYEIYLLCRALTHKTIVEINFSDGFQEDFKQKVPEIPLNGDIVYDILEKKNGIDEQQVSKIGKMTFTGRVGTTINGTPQNPVPVAIGEKMRVELRDSYSNSTFYGSGSNLERQITIQNQDIEIKLTKIFNFKDEGTRTIYIQEDGSGTKTALGNLNNSTGITEVNYTLKKNKTYYLSGFDTKSSYQRRTIERNSYISILSNTSQIRALEFDLGGKIFPSQASGMYTCLAKCDGFVTSSVTEGQEIEIGLFENFFYKNSFSSIQDGNKVYIGNAKGTLSTTAGNTMSLIGEKKRGGLLIKDYFLNKQLIKFKGQTDYSRGDYSGSRIEKSYFFQGGKITFQYALSESNTSLKILFSEASTGKIEEIIEVNGGTGSGLIELPAGYFIFEITMSNSKSIDFSLSQ